MSVSSDVETDRTLVLVDKFCTADEMQAHSFQFGRNGPYISLVTVALSFIYIAMGFVIIYFIKIQERNARLGDSTATKSVIFPVFVSCLWLNAIINVYIGIIFISDVWMKDSLIPALLFAVAFGLQHCLVDGVAILLMKKGLGWDGVKTAFPLIACWTVFTVVSKFFAFYGAFSHLDSDLDWLVPYSNAVNFIWSFILVIFYGQSALGCTYTIF